MVGARHQARRAAVQNLYQLDVQSAPPDADAAAALEPWLAESGLSGTIAAYARTISAGTWAARERWDRMIAEVSQRWDVSRMAVVDRSVLRLAVYELIERPDVPVRVIFDEAIELAREFGDASSPQFINGVLDAVWKHAPACRIARPDVDPWAGKMGPESSNETLPPPSDESPPPSDDAPQSPNGP